MKLVAVNIFNEHLQTVKKGCYPVVRVLSEAADPSPHRTRVL
jgi:hypothetical protein